MQTATPGSVTTVTHSGIPSGEVVGFQILSAVTGAVAIARTTNGVVERPLGSGNFVFVFNAPLLGDLYLLVIDWAGGAIEPGSSQVIELQVTATPTVGVSELGVVADYAAMYLGGETWAALRKSQNVGDVGITRAIAVVKARVQSSPTPPSLETTLPALVLDYLGLLTALQLIPAARDYWAQSKISESIGDDSSEIVSWINRAGIIGTLQEDLLRRLPAAQAAADPLLDSPTASLLSNGPMIDEDDDWRVTEDPRAFPPAESFPYQRDAYGYPR